MNPCPPQPRGLIRTKACELGEQYASRHGFLLGDRIEPFIERQGGTLHYLSRLDRLEREPASLVVWGPSDFDVYCLPCMGVERDRFSLAHELAHYVLHSREGTVQLNAPRFGNSPVEWEANWFASGFLMPVREFELACQQYGQNPERIAAHFLVSPQTVRSRMKHQEVMEHVSE